MTGAGGTKRSFPWLPVLSLLSCGAVFAAGYVAWSSVQTVQFIATGRTASITQYTGCEATAAILLPPVTILLANGKTEIGDSSSLKIAADVTADYRRTPAGLEIRLARGSDASRAESWNGPKKEEIEPLATVDTGSQFYEIPAAGGRILIPDSQAAFTVASQGVIEIGGLSGQEGAGALLSSEAQVTAVESPFIGSERIRFVDEKIEPFSILYSHPELIVPDETSSGGYRKDYAKVLKSGCSDAGGKSRQPLAFFAFTTRPSASAEGSEELMAISMMRRTDAIGLATLGEVIPVAGPPKLIQVSSWSRLVSSPALQAAFATALALVTFAGLGLSIAGTRKPEDAPKKPRRRAKAVSGPKPQPDKKED